MGVLVRQESIFMKEAGNGLLPPTVEDAGGKEPCGSCHPKVCLDRLRRMKWCGLE